MPVSQLGVPALAYGFAVGEDDSAHQRVGLHAPPASPGEVERSGHRLPLVHRRYKPNRRPRPAKNFPLLVSSFFVRSK